MDYTSYQEGYLEIPPERDDVATFTPTEPSRPFIPREKNPNCTLSRSLRDHTKKLPVQNNTNRSEHSRGASHNARHARTMHTDHLTSPRHPTYLTKYSSKTLEPGKSGPSTWPPSPDPKPKKITSPADMRTNTYPCRRPAKLSWREESLVLYCRGENAPNTVRRTRCHQEVTGCEIAMISWFWPETGFWV